ncbi:MAG: MlaE family ABC transporter permease [Prolixibacteraceae bacterium]
MKQKKKYLFSKGIDHIFIDLKQSFEFSLHFFRDVFKKPFHVREIIHQSFEVGIKSLSLIALTGFIIGIVFTKQSRLPLQEFGATSWLPSLIGIAMLKALGPLVTALICAGKVGSGIGAELGSMKVTEQIDAMEVSSINPFKYLVVTRVLATTIMVPILAIFFTFIGLYGSYLNVHLEETSSMVVFYQSAFSSIQFLDIYTALAKSIIFGFTIGIVGSYKGFFATQGTRGVGKAANQAVIVAMFLIFIEEILIVQISNWIRFY